MRTRAPRVPFVTLVSLVLVAGIVGLLLFNTSMQQASFAASSLENQADALAAREQTLRMELDVAQLPKPFQVHSINSSDWRLSSDWRYFTYRADGK